MDNKNIHFGKVNNPLPDWRKITVVGEDDDNDEDNDIEPDVKFVLGFNPDDIKTDE